MKRITISDVAERAGVSIATVSGVLNGKPGVRESTRARVQATIDAMGYRPVEAARRRLQRPGERTLALVVKEIHNPYFADIAVGAQEAARERGFHLVVMSSEQDVDLERDAVRSLAARDVDGFIINPLLDHGADLSHLFALTHRNVPFVLLEGLRGILQTTLIDVDNVCAAREATRHVIDLGHERIAHLAGPEYSMHAAERLEGVRRAFSELQRDLPDRWVVHAGASVEDGYRAGLDLFGAGGSGLPTAVTCYNDLVAIGLMGALSLRGLRVPEDVSVVGYDDIRLAAYLPVPLTTVHVPKREMGRLAAELLIERLDSTLPLRAERVRLDASLVVRSSTAPPRAALTG